MEPPPISEDEKDTPPPPPPPPPAVRPPRAPRAPSPLEIRLFYVRISPCAPDAVPPHLTLSHLRKPPSSASLEINGARFAAGSDPCSLSLRRDRVDRDAAEVTYVSTDSVRLSGAVDLEISDDRGNLILCGALERTTDAADGSVQHQAPSGSDKDPKTGWTMDCCTAATIVNSAFVQPKLGISAPSFEVYVAGCSAGLPLILTQTVHLAPRRKAARTGNVESLLEEDDASVREQKGDEGSHRRKAPSSSSVTESQSQANIGQTYPYQLVSHPQFASQTSTMQSQFQSPMVQPSPMVHMLPQPHYQPFLSSQYSHMQSQAQDQTQYQEQSQSQTGKRGTSNKRWKPHHDDFLIPFLVEQAREGMKVDKTLKRQAFVAAAIAVNARFRESFTWENVENHMRTLKTKYQEIKKCREQNGAIWNDELKMITLDGATYQTYIEANPKAKEFVNKPIDNYEGLRIICGDEPVVYKKNIFQPPKTGDAMDFDQAPVVHDEEVEAPAVGSTCTEAPAQTGPVAPPSPSSSRNGRAYKRLRDNIESVIMELARKVGDVAEAINNARPTHWTAELYERIMDLDEFEATIQEAAFDTLRRDEAEARAFIVKNKMMRYSWMERFMTERFSD